MRPLLDSTSNSRGSGRFAGGCQTACAVRGHLSRSAFPVAINSARLGWVRKAGPFLNELLGDSFPCDFCGFPMAIPLLLTTLRVLAIADLSNSAVCLFNHCSTIPQLVAGESPGERMAVAAVVLGREPSRYVTSSSRPNGYTLAALNQVNRVVYLIKVFPPFQRPGSEGPHPAQPPSRPMSSVCR